MTDALRVRILCLGCRATVTAAKVRKRLPDRKRAKTIWVNRCLRCLHEYPAPGPDAAAIPRKLRAIIPRRQHQERHTQRLLFETGLS
jgi:hypothetical protein